MNNEALSEEKKQVREQKSIFQSLRLHLFENNYALISSLKLSLPMAFFLLAFEELQKFAIISRLSTNPTISSSPQMAQVDVFVRYMLLDVSDVTMGILSRDVLIPLLLVAQIIVGIYYLVDLKEELLRKFAAKVIVIVQMMFTIPSILIGVQSLLQGQNVPISSILLFFTLANTLIYSTMQIQCSFERQNENVLVRPPHSITPRLIELATIAAFPLLSAVIYPTSFVIYLVWNLVGLLWQWGVLLRGFIYFQEPLSCMKGIMVSVNIAATVCYLSISLLANAIISQNVLIFITAFSVFLGYFFVVFRNHILKTAIINQELKQQQQIALFCLFYWHCYRKITEKKNELYLSSLLKKHLNQCQESTCCCKHRELLYDHSLKTYGNPQLQPHFDRIFIRHFIRKLLNKGYQEHNKSIMLALMLSTFDIQALEMVTQPIELIHRLTRMQQKKQLSFMEEYLLFCLKQKTKEQIEAINLKRGNLQLENVKAFDEKIINLQVQLKQSVKLYNSLWKKLSQSRLNQGQLYSICKETLQMMFSMENVYGQLKEINRESSELITIMLFYAKMVLHDIHLLSEIKKDLKPHHERNIIVTNIELGSLRLFGPYTATFISMQSGKIKWASKNAHNIFEYSREDFHGLTINQLMPKYFAEKHDGYIQKWKETGHHITLNTTSYLWGSARDGHCFSILSFGKVILLHSQQDYAFFTCLQKIDNEHTLICTQRGNIIGCGKLFADSLAINPRVIQELQPSLQIFMPSSFDYFLEYFFPDQTRHKSGKKSLDVRREGYFPQRTEQVMKQFCSSRSLFERNYGHQQSFQKEYLNFIRQKMQELTCSVNGQYVSFLMEVLKIVTLKRGKCDILSISVSNPKRDNIERYYADLEKMIKKLQDIIEESKFKKNKTVNKKNRSDFFRAFLNPRKVKKLLLSQNKEVTKTVNNQSNAENLRSDSCFKSDSYIGNKPRKTATMLVAHRKQLALGAQAEIKNQRVRYNIWKMKKVLLEQGIISRYTYNLLIGKQVSIESQNMVKNDPQAQETEKKSLKRFQEDGESDEEGKQSLDSDNHSQKELVGVKEQQNDCQTFNSATSSANFISMTNQVKFFKHKLRSLNSPRPLLVLNILVIAVAMGAVGGLFSGLLTNLDKSENGLSEFHNNMEANIIMSLLMEGQFNIQNLNNEPNNTLYQTKRKYFVGRSSSIFKEQIQRRMRYRQIDPRILSYLYMMVVDHNTPIQIKELIQIIINQMIEGHYSHIQKYFNQTLTDIRDHDYRNFFFDQNDQQLQLTFIILTSVGLFLFLLTLPIVSKVKTKIKDIYDLLKHISPNQKSKYSRHFRQLQEQFRKNNTYDDLTLIINNIDNRGKSIDIMTNVLSDDQILRGQSKSQLMKTKAQVNEKGQQNKQSISANKLIYIQLIGIFGVFLGALLFYLLFVGYFSTNVQTVNTTFVNTFNQQSIAVISYIQCNNQLMDYAIEAPSYSPTIGLVGAIYNCHHLSMVSNTFKDYVYRFVTAPACGMLTEPSPFNQFTAQELALCETINNRTFARGAINNIYYCQRKLEQHLTAYYVSKNFTPNDESNIHYPAYFLTQEYFEINVGHFFNSVMIYQLFDQMAVEMRRQVQSFKYYIKLGTAVTVLLVFLFLVLWLYIYWNLAQSASYINAFLLLIPFNILTENPYIKLYIRNEFDYKASNY